MFRQGVNSSGELLRDVFVEHEAVDLYCDPSEGMTRQEFKDECDINVLMASYERNGVMTHINKLPPQYLDVSAVPDLASAIAMMDAAETAFMTLPASVRREFDQNAVKFVEYASDPANIERMREWGLAPPAEPVGASAPAGAGAVASPSPSSPAPS